MERAEFLRTYERYRLGDLVTESPHPKTVGLSSLVHSDLKKAFGVLQEVDLDALNLFVGYSPLIEKLREACQQTLADGGRVFLCGCGATGRLSLTIEFLWREKFSSDQVISFMAGGDIALVHSLEGFEDYPEYGARHLRQLGFSEKDLLIGTTEGGETPYVIGAVEEATLISKRTPFMLYCNPDAVLVQKVERSRRVIERSDIHTLSLPVGPMALSGSTRMQASTVLQLALGFALIDLEEPVERQILKFSQLIKNLNFSALHEITKKEAQIYQQNEFVMYVPRQMAITVFTDTTERSPTFNLPSFEASDYKGNPSLCYILIPSAEDSASAWEKLLLHNPRPLDWPEVDKQTTSEYLQKFDFGKDSLELREARVGDVRQYLFEIDFKKDTLLMHLSGVELEFSFTNCSELFKHTSLKMLLNAHSTLLMGLLGRYESNIMTWVTATNGKLVDRASRYIKILLRQKGQDQDYLDIVNRVYDVKSQVKEDECIVVKVVNSFK